MLSLGRIKSLTPKSDAVGRGSMNFNNALILNKKMTFENKLRCQRSAGFFGYISIADNLKPAQAYSVNDF